MKNALWCIFSDSLLRFCFKALRPTTTVAGWLAGWLVQEEAASGILWLPEDAKEITTLGEGLASHIYIIK